MAEAHLVVGAWEVLADGQRVVGHFLEPRADGTTRTTLDRGVIRFKPYAGDEFTRHAAATVDDRDRTPLDET